MTETHRGQFFYLNLVLLMTLFSGYVLTTGLGIIPGDLAKNSVRISSGILAIISILLSGGFDKKTLFPIYLCIIMFLINENSILLNIIFLTIIVRSMLTLNHRYSSLAFFLASGSAVIVHLTAYYGGLVTSVVSEFGGRTRSALGFANPNQLALVYLSLVFSATYLYFHWKSKWVTTSLLLSIVVSISMIEAGDSRTSLFSLFMLFGLVLIAKISGATRVEKIFAIMAMTAPIVASAITLFLTFGAEAWLDEMLSFRPYMFSSFVSMVTFTEIWFGWEMTDEITVDNSYLALVSAVGLPISMIIIAILSRRLFYVKASHAPLVISIALAGVFESFIVRPEIPLGLMFFTIALAGSKDPKREFHRSRQSLTGVSR